MSLKSPAFEVGDSVPERCLSFTASGPWGHFRRVEGNIVKQTYRIIPRTTVAGFVAAMLGIGRDEYYDLFAPDSSLVSIEPISALRTFNLPVNALSTADRDIRSGPKDGGRLRIGLPDPTTPRQQHNYEMLVDPAYRIDIWMADEEVYDDFEATLAADESYYVPSLGLSECLAEVEYHGEFAIEAVPDNGCIAVDSVIPETVDSIVITEGDHYRLERSPAFMARDTGGRTTTGFRSYAYNPVAESLTVQGVSTQIVDGRTVMFA